MALSAIQRINCIDDMSWCGPESSLTPFVVCAFTGPASQSASTPALGVPSPAFVDLGGNQMPQAEVAFISPETLAASVVVSQPPTNTSFLQLAPAGASACYASEIPAGPSMTPCFHAPFADLPCAQVADMPSHSDTGSAWCHCQPSMPDTLPHGCANAGADFQLAHAMQAATQAATTATTALGPGSMPLAAQQVSPGLWCVLVADSSYGGGPGVPCAMSGSGHGSYLGLARDAQTNLSSGSALNLNLAEHLPPIPEAAAPGPLPSASAWISALGTQALELDAPCTPPPRKRNTEILPTPSPVCLQSAKPCMPASGKDGEPQALPRFPSLEGASGTGSDKVCHERFAQPLRSFRSPVNNTSLRPSATTGRRPDHANHHKPREQWHATAPRYQHPGDMFDQGRDGRYHKKRFARRGSSYTSGTSRFSEEPVADRPERLHNRAMGEATGSTSCLPTDPSFDSILQHAIWDLMEQVLMQRPRLEDGKRVNVTLASWLNQFPTLVSACQRRALVNRALRTLSRRLPGCCWTVDFESQDTGRGSCGLVPGSFACFQT